MALTAVIFVLAFVAGCFLALVRHPIYGLLTYVGTFYVHPPSRWWGQGVLLDVRWSLIVGSVTLLAVLLHWRKRVPVPVFRQPLVIGFALLVIWIAIQSFWALDPPTHSLLLSYYAKYLLVIVMIYQCLDSERNVRLFLWAHIIGCFLLAWIAFTSYEGGRFEDFGGPGLSEANAAGFTMTTAIFIASAFLMTGRARPVVAAIVMLPFLVNGVVSTVSRSAFLALGFGGIVYNKFVPQMYRRRVRVLSVLAVVLLAMLAGQAYWERIQSLKYRGADVEGVDTGSSRVRTVAAQVRMFRDYPFGCGHYCTAVLSPQYLEERDLNQQSLTRSSHNTFMSMLVEHGIPGGIFYIAMLAWVASGLRALERQFKLGSGLIADLLPAMAACFAAMTVADLFVPYIRYEVRFWLLAVLMVLVNMAREQASAGLDSELHPPARSG